MHSAAASAREILVRLHDVMAGRTAPQAKLNAVVQIIGETIGSEVCSIYLLAEGVLELYATRGLAQEAVHVTKLALGEGLVGTIAEEVEVLNLDEATSHPNFVHKPRDGGGSASTASRACRSSRRERAVGVLAIQHVDQRRYQDVEIEALQTVAMVLSELIANAGTDRRGDRRREPGAVDRIGADAGAETGRGDGRGLRGLSPAADHDRTYRRRGYRRRTPPRLCRVRQDARADRPDHEGGGVRRRGRA